MTRRPFASVLAVTMLGLALALALLVAVFPRPMQEAIDHCAGAGGICRDLLLLVRGAGSQLVLVVLLLQFAWSAWRGIRHGWREWRATGAALDYLGAGGRCAPPAGLDAVCAAAGVSGRVRVVAGSAPVAFCQGLWRPRIWLSTEALALLGPAELIAVLRHERAHQRHYHPLQLLVARALAAALPHLPVLAELAAVLPLAQELAADRAVIREGSREALGRALLALAEQHGQAPAPALAAGMLSSLDARIDQLTGATVALPRLSRRALMQTGAALGGGLLVLVLIACVPPMPRPIAPPPASHRLPGYHAQLLRAR